MIYRIDFLYMTADVVRKKICCFCKTFGVVKTIAWEKQLALLEHFKIFIVISLRRVPLFKPGYEEFNI